MPGPGWWARAAAVATFWCLAYVYLTVPDVRPLVGENPKSTAFMQLREAEARREGRKPQRRQTWVSYARISTNLKRAVLVAEDSAFWQHDGLDFEQIRESMEVNFERGEFARGASTITQQLAKNLYLSPSKHPVRKVRELLITRRLEAVLQKRRIFEIYVNVIEWGGGVWGAEAASRTHFGKSAGALSAEDGALLAAAIINPRVLNPGRPSPRLLRRQRMILRRMGRATPPPDSAPAAAPDAVVTPAAPTPSPPAQPPAPVPPGPGSPAPVAPGPPAADATGPPPPVGPGQHTVLFPSSSA